MTLYEITNLIDGMGYVGITVGRVKHRWWHHKDALKKGKHGNRWLQRAYNKYGSEAFEYKIRQICNSKEELGSLEKRIIGEEKGRLYNMRKGGYDAPPVKHTEESKRKISECQKIPIVGMSIKTGEIREYSCGKDAQLDGFNPKNIGKCCLLSISLSSGRIQQAISTGKWVWMYKSEFNLKEMNRRSEMANRRGNNDQSRPIMGKSLVDGHLVEFRSCLEASRSLKCHFGSIRAACLWTAAKSAERYVWIFADESNPTILLEERYSYALLGFNGNRRVRKPSSIKYKRV